MSSLSLFPDFLTFDLCADLVEKIKTGVQPYKNEVKEAVIYSLLDQKTLVSDRRVSKKTSFRSEELRRDLQEHLCPFIYTLLNRENSYNVTLGEGAFDYIKYDNGGYFEKHKDFIRMENPAYQQYTLLIGLTDKAAHSFGGYTVLWLPVNDANRADYTALQTATDEAVLKKYNLHGKTVKELLASCPGFLPHRIECYQQGRALLFRSDLLHSGEVYHSSYAAKELCMVSLGLTGLPRETTACAEGSLDRVLAWRANPLEHVIEFNAFEPFMLSLEEVIPFQVIIAQGDYKGKPFSDVYLRYYNFEKDLYAAEEGDLVERLNHVMREIYQRTKEKINDACRQWHVGEEILEESTQERMVYPGNGMRFARVNPGLTSHIFIENYAKNYTIAPSEGNITHNEKINNTWEESSCNDDGDEYDEVAYLNCKMDVKFCFRKVI